MSKHLLNGKRSFSNEKRSTGDRLSKCLIVVAVLSSVGSDTKYTGKRNQRGIRITGLCIGLFPDACISIVTKHVPFISSFFFFSRRFIRIPPCYVYARSRISRIMRRIMEKNRTRMGTRRK